MDGLRITELKASNVKGLKAVQIYPNGNHLTVGGDNGQGKTSLLDSIMYALVGKTSFPDNPVRFGEEKAEITVDIGDYTITRKIPKHGNPKLIIRNSDGAKMQSGETLLRSLVGDLTFDPLGFINMDRKKQIAVLKKLVGLDFTKLEAKAKEIYDTRTEVNREIKSLSSLIDGIPKHKDVPDKLVTVEDLMHVLTRIEEHNKNVDLQTEDITRVQRKIDLNSIEIIRNDKDIQRLEYEISKLKEKNTFARIAISKDDKKISELGENIQDKLDDSEVRQQITNAESNNRKYLDAVKRIANIQKLNGNQHFADELSEEIIEIENEKKSQLKSAKLPVSGLNFTPEAVTYNGTPINECSSAEQLSVSMAIGMAMNPNLKVMFIRDGSLLDMKSLGKIKDYANVSGYQLFIERVGDGDEVSVVIEAGEVIEDRTERIVEHEETANEFAV